MVEVKKPRKLKPEEPLDDAVYCANCKFFKDDVIGGKTGYCLDHKIKDSNAPMLCEYYHNDVKILSILIFLRSGISIYHKAIVPDMSKDLDPHLLSSFLQAINMFGEELAEEEVSQIQFQKINIFICRNNHAYGALLVKGEVDETCKGIFSQFLINVEENYPDYFEKDYKGVRLPEKEVDRIGLHTMKNYFQEKMYAIPHNFLEDGCKLKKWSQNNILGK